MLFRSGTEKKRKSQTIVSRLASPLPPPSIESNPAHSRRPLSPAPFQISSPPPKTLPAPNRRPQIQYAAEIVHRRGLLTAARQRRHSRGGGRVRRRHGGAGHGDGEGGARGAVPPPRRHHPHRCRPLAAEVSAHARRVAGS